MIPLKLKSRTPEGFADFKQRFYLLYFVKNQNKEPNHFVLENDLVGTLKKTYTESSGSVMVFLNVTGQKLQAERYYITVILTRPQIKEVLKYLGVFDGDGGNHPVTLFLRRVLDETD